MHELLPGILTALCAGAAAYWARSGAVRVAPACCLAAALAMRPGEAALVAAAAIAAGGGTGLAGPARPGRRAILSEIGGAAAALGAVWMLRSVHPLAVVAAAHLALQAMTAGLAAVSGAPDAGPRWRRAQFELVNIPAAFLLSGRLSTSSLTVLVCVLGLVLAAAYASRVLTRATTSLADAHQTLASRVSELATLHAISRDIVTTLDPGRVFSIVERECRKLFDVDFFFIGVLDRDSNDLRISYRGNTQDAPQEARRPVADGLASWVVREKRALRIDDATADGLPFQPEMVDASVRSVLAVPLLVDDRVVGVLSAQSRRTHAYDEHHLSVLATIAQQAAVAIENARHYALTTTDSLTGLYVRDPFFRRLEDEYARARRYSGPFAVLMLDLDGFKDINDRYGHAAGDRYLRAVGAVIKDRLRAADLACRYGGDEFCLLLPVTDLEGARTIAERVRTAIAQLVVTSDEASLRATVSIGIAAYPEHDAGDLKALLLRADQALYHAKRAGRDRVVPFAAYA